MIQKSPNSQTLASSLRDPFFSHGWSVVFVGGLGDFTRLNRVAARLEPRASMLGLHSLRRFVCLNDAVDEARSWKPWVSAKLRPDLVWRAHHAITTGLAGLHKSLSKLKQFYYWPGMAVDVQKVL